MQSGHLLLSVFLSFLTSFLQCLQVKLISFVRIFAVFQQVFTGQLPFLSFSSTKAQKGCVALFIYVVIITARMLASQAEAIVRTGKTWPQATKRRTGD